MFKRLNDAMTAARTRSATAQWMLDHPFDRPCPTEPRAAAAWRRARCIGPNASARQRAIRAKYDAAMREKREREKFKTLEEARAAREAAPIAPLGDEMLIDESEPESEFENPGSGIDTGRFRSDRERTRRLPRRRVLFVFNKRRARWPIIT